MVGFRFELIEVMVDGPTKMGRFEQLAKTIVHAHDAQSIAATLRIIRMPYFDLHAQSNRIHKLETSNQSISMHSNVDLCVDLKRPNRKSLTNHTLNDFTWILFNNLQCSIDDKLSKTFLRST